MVRMLRVTVVVVMMSVLGCTAADDDEEPAASEPIGSIVATSNGWSLETDGVDHPPGEHPVLLVNERDEDADFTLFLAEDDLDPTEPPGSNAEVVVEETVAGGEELELDVEFSTPGEYLSHVIPERVSETGSRSSPGFGITIVEE